MNRIADHKSDIAAAFSAAAQTYERGADVQRTVAERLSARIAQLPLPAYPRVLEIGCGTGFLTRSLRQRIRDAQWTVTDISQAMVEQCRKSLRDADDVDFRVMDGEAPDLPGGTRFDLICSSLAIQWFEDLPTSLERMAALLNHGGHLVFSTLALDTFREWRAAYDGLNETPGTLECLPVENIAAAIPDAGESCIEEDHIMQPYKNGLHFLSRLREIGAQSPRKGHTAAAPGTLRKVLRRFDADPRITYHVVYGIFTRR